MVDEYRVAIFKQTGDYCVALCAEWLWLRYLEMGSGVDGAKSRMRLDQARAALVMEKAGGNGIAQPARVLAEYQLKIDGRTNILPSINRVYVLTTEVKRRMHMILINCPRYNNENHALAVYQSKGGRMHFFDPNEGEYLMKKSQFEQFLVDFLAEKYHANSCVDVFAVAAL